MGVSLECLLSHAERGLPLLTLAFVVPRPGAKLDAADVIAWCGTRLADFKVPRHIWLVESLPKTETQRTEKYHLRQLACDLLSGAGQAPESGDRRQATGGSFWSGAQAAGQSNGDGGRGTADG